MERIDVRIGVQHGADERFFGGNSKGERPDSLKQDTQLALFHSAP